MHQFFILILFIGLLAFDADPRPVVEATPWTVTAVAFLGQMFCLIWVTAVVGVAWYQIDSRKLMSPPHWAQKLLGLTPLLILTTYIAGLAMGWPGLLRERYPGTLVLPDLAVVIPPIGLMVFAHLGHALIRTRTNRAYRAEHPYAELDYDAAPRVAVSLRNYVRHHVAIVAVPLLLLLTWHRLVDAWFVSVDADTAQYLAPGLKLMGLLMILFLSPAIIRQVWDTRPLTPGPVLERLVNLCKMHGVQVSQVLVWHTGGHMINAAVMGASSRLRYILLSDALLERVPPSQIEAVMAHEIAHVRFRHIPWLLIVGLALLITAELLTRVLWWTLETGLQALREVLPGGITAGLGALETNANTTEWGMLIVVILLWLPLFGWVSRRFEREADVFAVEHFAALDHGESGGVITEAHAQTVADALDTIARLNHIPPAQPSWRHGSMRFRIDHLLTLPGQKIGTPEIHQTVARIKAVGMGFLVLVVLIELVIHLRG